MLAKKNSNFSDMFIINVLGLFQFLLQMWDELLIHSYSNVHNMYINIGFHAGITRYLRDLAPAHFQLKIQSYSLLAEAVDKYDSGVFETGGHKW